MRGLQINGPAQRHDVVTMATVDATATSTKMTAQVKTIITVTPAASVSPLGLHPAHQRLEHRAQRRVPVDWRR